MYRTVKSPCCTQNQDNIVCQPCFNNNFLKSLVWGLRRGASPRKPPSTAGEQLSLKAALVVFGQALGHLILPCPQSRSHPCPQTLFINRASEGFGVLAHFRPGKSPLWGLSCAL